MTRKLNWTFVLALQIYHLIYIYYSYCVNYYPNEPCTITSWKLFDPETRIKTTGFWRKQLQMAAKLELIFMLHSDIKLPHFIFPRRQEIKLRSVWFHSRWFRDTAKFISLKHIGFSVTSTTSRFFQFLQIFFSFSVFSLELIIYTIISSEQSGIRTYNVWSNYCWIFVVISAKT